MTDELIIMGVDPGTRVTGYGIIRIENNRCHVLDFGAIKPPPSALLSNRYAIIFECLDALLETYKPSDLALETQFVKNNVQSAIKLGMAKGMALLAAKRRGLKIFEYAPTQAKSAVTGNGHASKQQVQSMTASLLNLDQIPEPEDAADALALAICHAHMKERNSSLGTSCEI